MITFRFLYKISALLFLLNGATLLFSQDSGPGDPGDELHIDAVVGEPLDFPLDAPSGVTDMSIDGLPNGLQFDAAGGKIVGTATTVGEVTAQLTFTEGSVTNTVPVYFHVHPEGTVPGPPPGPDGPLWIVGVVGEPLNFPLPYDPSTDGVDFGQNPDGTQSVLPAGLELDVDNGSIVGVPQNSGEADFTLIIVKSGGELHHLPIVFEIHPEGTVPEPPPGPDGPIWIVGTVGEPLHFPLPYDPSTAGADFGQNPDGTPSVLPVGLELDVDAGAFVGIPQNPGQTDFTLIIAENSGELHHQAIVFEIHPQGEHPEPPPGEPIVIFGIVGEPLNFPLPYDPQNSGIDFGQNPDGSPSVLPVGLQVDSSAGSVVGVPEVVGVTDFTLIVSQDGQSWHMPIVFEIHEQGTEPPIDPSDDLIHIFGVVGEPLDFPLPYDSQNSVVNLDPDGDGQPIVFPNGLQLDTSTGVIVGTPAEPGVSDLTLEIVEGENIRHMAIVFDIYPSDGPGGPGGDEPVFIFGKVGEPLHFPLPYDAQNSQIDFDQNADGTPSTLPVGLELDSVTGSIVGTPEEPGFFDLGLIVIEGENTRHLPVAIDIQPAGSHGGNPPIHILGNVGHPIDFPLPIGPEFTEIQIDHLPEGLEFNPDLRSIVGTPLFPGYHESGISALKDGQTLWLPVFFDIFGDFPPDGGPGNEEIKVHGLVGEFLSFPLPFPIDLVQIELTQYADGTLAPLPVGIEFDSVNAQFIGFPQEPGFFESTLTVVENDESREVPVFFDIQHGFGGEPPLPPHEEYEDEDIILFGEVGTRFSFQFPTDENEVVELPDVFEGEEFGLPTGLIYNADLNAITGSPTESGLFEALVSISKGDVQDHKVLRFLISDSGDAPRLSFFSESEYQIGQPFSFPILASGEPTSYSVVDGLPEGVLVDGQTGIVSGTLDFEEDYDLVVKVSNSAGDAYGIHFLDANFPRPDDGPPPPPDGEEHVEETEPFPGRLGVPFRLEAPEEFANAVFTLLEGESFPAGIGFDSVENAVITGTPTEAGYFQTGISIDREGKIEKVILTFFIFDDAGAPQFVSSDFIRIRPGDPIDLPLIIANGPADITIETDLTGISLDAATSTLRGTINEPGFYSVVALAENESGSAIHLIDIDVWDDGSHHNPNDGYSEPHYVWAFVGEPIDFPLPADPSKSDIVFVESADGSGGTLPLGLEYIADYALIRGIPEAPGRTELLVEITEFGFTRNERIIFEIQDQNDNPDGPHPNDPGHGEPDDGHVEPILGKVGERLFFEAPISGENITFELVPGPDGEASELPPGITFDDQGGIISGVPTRSGIYPIWVKVDDNGSVRTHFAPLLISGPEGAPEIVSEPFISLNPREHFEFQVAAKNNPTNTYVEFFDVPGILSYDADTMVLKGKFEFGGFFTLLIVAENEAGTGYGLLNVDVLGFNNDPNGGGDIPSSDIPLHINGAISEEINFELPSYVRGSSFVVTEDSTGIAYSHPLNGLPEGLSIDSKTGRISGTPVHPGFYFVHVTVDDGELPGLAINIGIVDSLPTPKIFSSDWVVGQEGAPFQYRIYATDHPSEYFATGLPSGLSLDPVSGLISGTPSEAGEFDILLSARNASGIGEERALYLRIEERRLFPVISAPRFSEGQVGESFSLQVNSTHDPDSFQAWGLPFGLEINAVTGLISGIPEQDGFFDVRLEAHNEWGMGAFHISILVKRALSAPVYLGPKDLAGKVGQPFFFNPPIQGAAFAFSISENSPNPLPAGLNIDSGTGLISGLPEESFRGIIEVVVEGESGSIIVPLTLEIVPALEAPSITSASYAKGTAGQAFEYRILATNNPTEYRADGLSAGLALDSATGLISGSPENAGYYDLFIQARNADGWGRPRLLVLDITPALQAPIVVSAPFARGKAGEPFAYQIFANNSPSSYLVVGELPGGLSLDPASGLISGTPTQAGVREVIVAASNGSGVGNGMVLILSIQASQAMPKIISSGTAFGKVNEPFQYRIVATGEPTSFEAENLPDGLTLNEATGFITGTPVQATTKPIFLIVFASNAAGTSLPRAVILEILPSREAPVIISGGHALGKTGEDFEFQVFATNNPTSFFSPNLPQGLSIDSETGLISGVPQAAGEFKVTLQASNAAGSGDPSSLVLFILPGAEMPKITSAPYARGKVGEAFEYQIETSADTIDSYQLSGELPRGLDFDPVSGLISGSPVEPGVAEVKLSASNEAGTSLPQSLIMKIEPALEAPVIVSSLHVRGTVGEELAYEIQATSMPEERPLPQGSEFDAIGLPAGLGVNQSTGVISGTPEEAGRFAVDLVATNVSGRGNPKTLVLEIHPSLDAPKVISASKVAAQVGQPFNYAILATNSPSAYDVEHAISWLSVDTATGFLSGNPEEPGVFYAEMMAENESGRSEYAPLHIVVYPAEDTPKIISDRQVEGQIGTEFSYQIEATQSPTGYAVNGLPSGLSLNGETGEISGVPTASGEFEIVMAASNDNGRGTKAILVLKIRPRSTLNIVVTNNSE